MFLKYGFKMQPITISQKPVLPFLETMITYACNLSCHGCTNYSDYNMKGSVTWEQGRADIEPWLKRVDIPDFGILGGEPLLNPDLKNWIYGLRELLPNAQIRFTTNAKLFMRKKEVLDWCLDIGNCVFKFTIHQDAKYVQDSVEYVRNRTVWWPVHEYGINRWSTHNNVKFQINYPTHFFKTYQGTYVNMKPFDNNPKDAFDICIQQTCPLLFNGKIYKCSSIALLSKVLDDWGHVDDPDWEPYAKGHGLSIGCSDHDLQKFINNFGKPAGICRMCPTSDNIEAIVDHKANVVEKKGWRQHV